MIEITDLSSLRRRDAGLSVPPGRSGCWLLLLPRRVRALLDSARAAGAPGHFLTAAELDVLSALTDRLIPGPPEDPTPGALEAGVAHAIDLLLAAFELTPPLIHAGGPFSNRAGSHRDDFAHFVPLDRQAELGWRIRLEGSRGIPEREFAGPVTGLQEIYRQGLAHLDQRSHSAYGSGFAAVSSQRGTSCSRHQRRQRSRRFIGAALANTLEAMYGPPEYGGEPGPCRMELERLGRRHPATRLLPRARDDSRPRRTGARREDAPCADTVGHVSTALTGALLRPTEPQPRDAWWLARGRFGRR